MGFPASLTSLCDRALLGAYTEGKLHIDKRIVRLSANEVLADELQQTRTGISPKLLVSSIDFAYSRLALSFTSIGNVWDLDNVPDQTAIQPSPEMSTDETTVDKPLPQVTIPHYPQVLCRTKLP